MADSKQRYSDNSTNYVKNDVAVFKEAEKNYNNSKRKEEKYNEKWSEQKVNLNETVDKFTPNAIEYVSGYKYVYEGEKYKVVTDMVSGSLRIINKETNQPVKLDGKPGNRNETHFKIMKRGEM